MVEISTSAQKWQEYEITKLYTDEYRIEKRSRQKLGKFQNQ